MGVNIFYGNGYWKISDLLLKVTLSFRPVRRSIRTYMYIRQSRFLVAFSAISPKVHVLQSSVFIYGCILMRATHIEIEIELLWPTFSASVTLRLDPSYNHQSSYVDISLTSVTHRYRKWVTVTYIYRFIYFDNSK